MSELKTAAVYVRVSTDDQVEISPDSQLEMIRSFAEKNSYIIPEEYIFVDEGISGRTAKKRPEFNRMIALCKQTEHPVDTILLWKFSRFARNQEESIVYKAMLKKANVDVVSISEPIIDGPFGTLIERIIEWMDEYYSIRLSGEVKRSMTLMAQRGGRVSIPPFGYRMGKEGEPSMVPVEVEAEIVRSVFEDYANGVPVWQILNRVNSTGITTHRGNPCDSRAFMYWFRNPVYIGKNRWTPTGRIRRDFNNPDSIITDGDHEPIISDELWRIVNERADFMSARYKPKKRPSFELKDWMGGVARCAACGSTLVYQGGYFICNAHVRGRCTQRQSIRLDYLHEAVLSQLHTDLNTPIPLRYVQHNHGDNATEIKALENQLSNLEKRLSRAKDAYTAGIDTLEEYKHYRDQISAESNAISQKLSDLHGAADPAVIAAALRDQISATLETLENPDTTKEQKNESIRSLLDNCTWDKSNSLLQLTYSVYL